MSQTITCPRCGRPKDVPAYPGDGVYTHHTCDPDHESTPLEKFARSLAEAWRKGE